MGSFDAVWKDGKSVSAPLPTWEVGVIGGGHLFFVVAAFWALFF